MTKTAYLALQAGLLMLVVSAATPANATTQSTNPRQTAAASAGLTNADILKMVKAGLGDTVVIAAIDGAASQQFDLTPAGLIALKSGGVADTIIAAMQRKAGSAGAAPAAAAPTTSAAAPARVGATTSFTIPAGTEVKVQIGQTIASDQAKVGQVVQFTTAADVAIDGQVVIPRDSAAFGTITKVVAQRFTRAGSLAFTIDSLKAGEIDVALKGSQTVGGGRGMVTANEASVAAGTIFTAVVDHDQPVTLAGHAPAPRSADPPAPASAGPRSGPGAAPSTPTGREAGIYVDMGNSQEPVELEPTVFTQGKTGGVFTSAMTYGIKKMKWKAVVRGRRANLRVRGTQPTFYFYFERSQNTGGAFSGWMGSASSPNEFVLARMEQTDSARELVVGEFGAFGGDTGTRSEDTVDLKIEKLGPGVYRATPATPLEVGHEYCLFYAAGANAMGAGTAGKLFDFGVDIK